MKPCPIMAMFSVRVVIVPAVLHGLDGPACLVQIYRLLAEVRLVSHMTGGRGMMSKDNILRRHLARAHALEEGPQVRLHIVGRVRAFVDDVLINQFLPHRRIVLRMPFLRVFSTHRVREAEGIITRRTVASGLWNMCNGSPGDFKDALRSHQTNGFWRFRSERQAHVNRSLAVIE